MEFRLSHQPYRKNPFVARWSDEGKIRNRFFATEAARTRFIEAYHGQDAAIPLIEPRKLYRWLPPLCCIHEAVTTKNADGLEGIPLSAGVSFVKDRRLTEEAGGSLVGEARGAEAGFAAAVPGAGRLFKHFSGAAVVAIGRVLRGIGGLLMERSLATCFRRVTPG